MILHSIISPYDIFCKRDEPPREYRRVQGGIVGISGGRVKSLFSTDPAMYLRKEYQPDTVYRGK